LLLLALALAGWKRTEAEQGRWRRSVGPASCNGFVPINGGLIMGDFLFEKKWVIFFLPWMLDFSCCVKNQMDGGE
jgi:hypothetical protein